MRIYSDFWSCMCIWFERVQSRYRAKKSTNKRKKNKDTHKSIRCRQCRLPSCLVFLLFCSKTSRTWTRCSFAKASGGQKTELISHLKSICIDTFWQHTGCFENYLFVECWKPRLGYRHTDDYVWPFNCLEFSWVHKYPFKRCGWFFGIRKAELIFAFLDAREQGKRFNISQWQVQKTHKITWYGQANAFVRRTSLETAPSHHLNSKLGAEADRTSSWLLDAC